MLGPVVPPHGPSPCRVCVVAEHPGTEESAHGIPLIGPAGKELRRMFDQLGVSLDDVFKTNLFNQQPPNNDVALYYTTPSPSPASRALGPLTTAPMAYANDDAIAAVGRLHSELEACSPNVVIALGNIAAWALIGRQGITSIRGSVHPCHLASGRTVKVIATYHPAAVLRQYSLRTIAICDLEKALAEATTPDLRYDRAEIWTEPSLDDLQTFGELHLERASICSLDVETRRGQLTCVGIAPSRSHAIVVPFWRGASASSYWPDTRSELVARKWLARWIEDPALAKVTQNGLYDVQYLAREGFKPCGFTEDTMLAHHSLYSELPKSLEFLGATYGSWPAWKGIHKVAIADQLKKDD